MIRKTFASISVALKAQRIVCLQRQRTPPTRRQMLVQRQSRLIGTSGAKLWITEEGDREG